MGNETDKKEEKTLGKDVKDIIIRLVDEDGRIGIYLVQGLSTLFLGYTDEVLLSKEMARLSKFLEIYKLNPIDGKLRDYLRQEILERLVRIIAYIS